MRRLRQAVARWLENERLGRDEQAEAALRGVLERLPRQGPRRDLAAAVLARAVGRPAGAERAWPRWCAPLARVMAIAALVAAAIGAAVAPAVLVPVVRVVGREGTIGAVWNVAVIGARLMERALAVLEILADATRLAADLLATPPVVLTLLGTMALAVGAFRMLDSLLVTERRARHARCR